MIKVKKGIVYKQIKSQFQHDSDNN